MTRLAPSEWRLSRLALSWWRRIRRPVQIVWYALRHLLEDGGTVFAGHIAFASLFALFPFLIFLITLAGQIGQDEAAREMIEYGLSALPDEVAGALEPAIREVLASPRTGLMTVSIVASLWAVSSGIEALRTALNHAYGVEERRPIWLRRPQSLLLTVVLSIAVLLATLALVVAPIAWSFVQSLMDVPRLWTFLYNGLRILFGVVLFYLVVVLLYRSLPNRRVAAREVFPGAVATVVLWVALASLFSFYLENLARFSVTYGSLGGIVMTLVFFYLSALIFIFGAEINSAARRMRAAQLRDLRARQLELRAKRRDAASG